MDSLKLDCCICLKRFDTALRKPKILPGCGHSLCSQCVTGLVEGGHGCCPKCRQAVPDWHALATNWDLLEVVEQLAPLSSDGSTQQQFARTDSGRIMLRARSSLSRTSVGAGSISGSRAQHGTQLARTVAQLCSREPQQQLQAATILANLTATPGEEQRQQQQHAAAEGPVASAGAAEQAPDRSDPSADASAAAAAAAASVDGGLNTDAHGSSSSGASERYQAVCRQVAEAGAIPQLVALLQQTPGPASEPVAAAAIGNLSISRQSDSHSEHHSSNSAHGNSNSNGAAAGGGQDSAGRNAEELQRLGMRVLFCLLAYLPETHKAAVDAGVLPVLVQLLRCRVSATQELAVSALSALLASIDPGVEVAVLALPLLAPVAGLLRCSSAEGVLVGGIELLQVLLKAAAASSSTAAGPLPAAAAASPGRTSPSTADAAGAVAALAALLLNSPCAGVRDAAYTALWTWINTAGPAAVVQQTAALLRASATQLAGFDLLTGLLSHFQPSVPVAMLGSAGVAETALGLLGSYDLPVQAAAVRAAAAMAIDAAGAAALVSIRDGEALKLLVAALVKEDLQDHATAALQRIAAHGCNPALGPQAATPAGAAFITELRKAGAIPAALRLLGSSMDPGSRAKPSGAAVRSAAHMLQWCSMRPEGAAVIRQAGGVAELQRLQGHGDPVVVQMAGWMLMLLQPPGV